MILAKNTDLAPRIQGWETAAADAFDIAFFTANWTAAASIDGGKTFTRVSPDDLAGAAGDTFCCDQGVTYIPSINAFVWVLLTAEGPIVLAIASPDQIRDSKGLSWTFYHLTARTFHFESDEFDYPDICFGDNFLYLTFNSVKQGAAVLLRYPLQQLAARGTITGRFAHVTDASYICPAQLTGNAGWFGTLIDPSKLRVYKWPEAAAAPVSHFDLVLQTIPSEDWSSFTPDHDDWLPPTSKIGTAVTGAARAGQELWFAWSGGRKVSGQQQNTFPHPHIGLAIVNLQGQRLIGQKYVWNAEHAFAWPALAANPAQEVAISYAYGGGGLYPQHGVGTVRRTWDFQLTTSGKSTGSGGHYVRVGLSFPDIDNFVSGGYVALKEPTKKDPNRVIDHPHYVVFRPT
jgi:hypothetical protein